MQIECDVPDVLDVVSMERPCAGGAESLEDACVKWDAYSVEFMQLPTVAWRRDVWCSCAYQFMLIWVFLGRRSLVDKCVFHFIIENWSSEIKPNITTLKLYW